MYKPCLGLNFALPRTNAASALRAGIELGSSGLQSLRLSRSATLPSQINFITFYCFLACSLQPSFSNDSRLLVSLSSGQLCFRLSFSSYITFARICSFSFVQCFFSCGLRSLSKVRILHLSASLPCNFFLHIRWFRTSLGTYCSNVRIFVAKYKYLVQLD